MISVVTSKLLSDVNVTCSLSERYLLLVEISLIRTQVCKYFSVARSAVVFVFCMQVLKTYYFFVCRTRLILVSSLECSFHAFRISLASSTLYVSTGLWERLAPLKLFSSCSAAVVW